MLATFPQAKFHILVMIMIHLHQLKDNKIHCSKCTSGKNRTPVPKEIKISYSCPPGHIGLPVPSQAMHSPPSCTTTSICASIHPIDQGHKHYLQVKQWFTDASSNVSVLHLLLILWPPLGLQWEDQMHMHQMHRRQSFGLPSFNLHAWSRCLRV